MNKISKIKYKLNNRSEKLNNKEKKDISQNKEELKKINFFKKYSNKDKKIKQCFIGEEANKLINELKSKLEEEKKIINNKENNKFNFFAYPLMEICYKCQLEGFDGKRNDLREKNDKSVFEEMEEEFYIIYIIGLFLNCDFNLFCSNFKFFTTWIFNDSYMKFECGDGIDKKSYYFGEAFLPFLEFHKENRHINEFFSYLQKKLKREDKGWHFFWNLINETEETMNLMKIIKKKHGVSFLENNNAKLEKKVENEYENKEFEKAVLARSENTLKVFKLNKERLQEKLYWTKVLTPMDFIGIEVSESA